MSDDTDRSGDPQPASGASSSIDSLRAAVAEAESWGRNNQYQRMAAILVACACFFAGGLLIRHDFRPGQQTVISCMVFLCLALLLPPNRHPPRRDCVPPQPIPNSEEPAK